MKKRKKKKVVAKKKKSNKLKKRSFYLIKNKSKLGVDPSQTLLLSW